MESFKQVKKADYFSDFFTNFTSHPETEQLLRKTNADAIKQSVRNLILTSPGERFFSDIGSEIRKSLFENFSPQIVETLKKQITNCIEIYEPRAKLTKVDIQANPDANYYAVSIFFIPLNGSDINQLNLKLFRVR